MVKMSRLLIAAALLAAVVGAQAQRGKQETRNLDRGKVSSDAQKFEKSPMPDLRKATPAKIAINGDRVKALNRNAVKVGGNTYMPARPLARELGGDIEKRGDDYYMRHQGREFRFRPGSRVYYYDDEPRYFPGAPFLRSGQLFLPGVILGALGARYYYDDYGYDHYWLGDRDTWMGPGQLSLHNPRNGGRFTGDAFAVDGYASPLRDVRVLVYRRADRGYGYSYGNQLVYSTMLRAGRRGDFYARIPFYGDGVYRIVVQVLNDYGGIEAEQTSEIFKT